MVANAHQATIADLDAIPDDGHRYELLNGVITMTAAPTWKHQLVARGVFRLIDQWVSERGIGDTMFPPVDVVLDGRHVVQPDILYLDDEHLANVHGNRVDCAPQLVVEVISPTSRSRDAVEKPMRYAQAGASEYWLIDPQLETAALFTLLETVYVERAANDDWTLASVVLPGLTLDHVAMFAAVDDRMRKTSAQSGDG